MPRPSGGDSAWFDPNERKPNVPRVATSIRPLRVHRMSRTARLRQLLRALASKPDGIIIIRPLAPSAWRDPFHPILTDASEWRRNKTDDRITDCRSGFFLVGGFPSGGTDLLRSVLNAHPEIYISGEMPFLHTLPGFGYHADMVLDKTEEVETLRSLLKRIDEWDNLENIDGAVSPGPDINVASVLRTFFSRGNHTIWGNKTPQNSENQPELRRLFPGCFFILITRDVRDVCASWRRKWGKSMLLCAHRWAERMSIAAAELRRNDPAKNIQISYESLLDDPKRITNEVTDFLGLEWSDRMLEHDLHVSQTLDGKINYGQPLKPQNKGKWNQSLDRTTVQRIEEIAYDTMVLLGYRPEFADRRRPLTPLETPMGYLHDLASIVLVGNRYSAKNGIVDRLGALAYEIRKRRR